MMDWQIIDSDEALAGLLQRYAGAPAVALDTEFMRRNTFYPQIALLQLCFDECAWLIDPLAISDLAPLRELLANPGLVKVLHSGSEDLEVFKCWLGELPLPLFDTQRAAAMLGRGFGLGYRALVQQICDVDLPKGETRSDWLQRPLSESQCQYAAQDVQYLLQVYEVLREECDKLERTSWVLEDGRVAVYAQQQAPEAYYKKIKSAWKLDPGQLSLLSVICEWRERTAREKDKPRSWIIDDAACLAIATAAPAGRSALQEAADIPPSSMRRYGQSILDCVAEHTNTSEAVHPEPLPAPLSQKEREWVKRMKKQVRAIAQERGLAPEILLQARDYEALLRSVRKESVTRPAHWSGWREAIVIAPLEASLKEWLS